MEPDDSAETASSQVSKQNETKQDETLVLSSAAGKHSSYSNVILSQIMSSMEPSVQLPVGSLESMDRELGRMRTDLKFLQQLPVLSPEPMDRAFQLGQEDSEIPKLVFEQGKGDSELPEVCLDLHAYDPNATEDLTIREFCLWHIYASKTGRDDVFAGIMDLLQVNPWQKDIDIRVVVAAMVVDQVVVGLVAAVADKVVAVVDLMVMGKGLMVVAAVVDQVVVRVTDLVVRRMVE
ncbi:unnamed protein product [Sphagnum tenellum]